MRPICASAESDHNKKPCMGIPGMQIKGRRFEIFFTVLFVRIARDTQICGSYNIRREEKHL